MATKRKREPVLALDAQPTKERMAKTEKDYHAPVDMGVVKLTMWDNPLDRAYWVRRDISSDQYYAGQSYRESWYKAGQAGRVGPSWLTEQYSGTTAGLYGSESIAMHREKYHEARRVLEPLEITFLEAVVCHERPLEEGGYLLGLKSRMSAIRHAGKWLRDVLQKLVGVKG